MLQDKFDDALLNFQKVLIREPQNALARVNVGYICLKKHIFGEAIEHLSRAIRLGNDKKATLYAHFYLGLVYLDRDMFEDAQTFQKTLAWPNLTEGTMSSGVLFNGQPGRWRHGRPVRGEQVQSVGWLRGNAEDRGGRRRALGRAFGRAFGASRVLAFAGPRARAAGLSGWTAAVSPPVFPSERTLANSLLDAAIGRRLSRLPRPQQHVLLAVAPGPQGFANGSTGRSGWGAASRFRFAASDHAGETGQRGGGDRGCSHELAMALREFLGDQPPRWFDEG